MGKQLNIGIIGIGRWGTNYLKTLKDLENAKVKWICSRKKNTLRNALQKVKMNSFIKKTTNHRDILNDKEVDAVVIASDGFTHYALTKQALLSNKHVIVEKPLAFCSEDVEELIKISNERKKILMVGHLHIYNPGIQKLKEDIKNGVFGKIHYIYSAHFGNGPVRTDMSALWDFFPHSVSIFLYLIGRLPSIISANGASYLNKGLEDIVTMDLGFTHNIFATSIGSWIYPIKKMEVTVVGDKLHAIFDDYAKSNKLKYYDAPNLIGRKNMDKNYDFFAPKLRNLRPLTQELKHFIDCINKNKNPLTDGEEALEVTRVLEIAHKSIKNNGTTLKL